MLVEIYGGGFENKGAQLMVSTVVNELSKRIDGIEFCMAWRRDRSINDMLNSNCKPIFPSHIYAGRRNGFPLYYKFANLVSCLIKEKHLTPYGLVNPRKCDAVIDISGFAFGDVWGPLKTIAFATVAKSYRKRNKPVIMLPQMLGPFKNQACNKAFKKLAQEVSVLYARDRVSEKHAAMFPELQGKLKKAADITIFADHSCHSEIPKIADVFLIPNSHVLTKKTTDWSQDAYIGTFTSMYHKLENEGLDVKILVHDYIGLDENLAEKIALSILPTDSQSIIYKNSNPQQLKQAISQCKFIVGSRFHGLVAALANDVPTIAIGWGHKYTELLHDFGQDEFNIESSSESEKLLNDLLPRMIDNKTRNDAISKMQKCKDLLRDSNETMWDDVVKRLHFGKHSTE